MKDILAETVIDFDNKANDFIEAEKLLCKNTIICNRNYVICIDGDMQARLLNFNQLTAFPKIMQEIAQVENVFINKNFCFYDQTKVSHNFGIFRKQILFYMTKSKGQWKNFDFDLSQLDESEVSAIGEGPIRNYSKADLVIPRVIRETRHRTFMNNLSIINLSSSLETVGKDTFFKCENLRNAVLDECKDIDDNAFGECSSLVNVKLPCMLTHIGNQAFAGCTSLSSINLEDTSLSDLENQVFANCKSLTSITLPKTIKHIDHGAFRGCTSLSTVIIPDISSVVDLGITAEDNLPENFKVNVPSNLVEEWRTTESDDNKGHIIGNSKDMLQKMKHV